MSGIIWAVLLIIVLITSYFILRQALKDLGPLSSLQKFNPATEAEMKEHHKSGKIPVHSEEISVAHPRVTKERSPRGQVDGDGDGLGSGNLIPDDDELNLNSSHQRREEEAAKAIGKKRKDTRVENWIEAGLAIISRIFEHPAAKRKFEEDMKKMKEERINSWKKAMNGCIARAYENVDAVTGEQIAEVVNASVDEVREYKRKVDDALRQERDVNSELYEKLAHELLEKLGYDKELQKLAVEREIEVRREERQGKDPRTFVAAVVYNVLKSGKNVAITQAEIEKKMEFESGKLRKWRSKHMSNAKAFSTTPSPAVEEKVKGREVC